VTFQVSNVANDAAKQKISDVFKTTQPVIEVSSSLQGNIATYNVTMPKKGRVHTMQSMLVKAGVESVNVDGTVVESAKLAEYAKSKKASKTPERKKK